jgi:hypothetical protein
MLAGWPGFHWYRGISCGAGVAEAPDGAVGISRNGLETSASTVPQIGDAYPRTRTAMPGKRRFIHGGSEFRRQTDQRPGWPGTRGMATTRWATTRKFGQAQWRSKVAARPSLQGRKTTRLRPDSLA